MINEIKKRLGAGLEVKLECIDAEKYLTAARTTEFGISLDDTIATENIIVVKNIDDIGGEVVFEYGTHNRLYIDLHLINHFRIVTSFDDLIDVAVKAVRNRVIGGFRFCTALIGETDLIVLFDLSGDEISRFNWKHSADGINFIESLYAEIFVIESMEDIDSIKWDTAKAVLANECELDLNILYSAVNRNVMLRLLKGATVTQKKETK